MARDSLFNESILWTGQPAALRTPPLYQALALSSASLSVVALLFAVVAALALQASVGGMVFFSAWCAFLAVAAWRLPLVWQSRVEYVLTERHVIWRRGALRRTIDRHGISYARIHWIAPNVGDLVLVRAVPTGALRRTLTLTLQAVEAPDHVWAMVRGMTPPVTLGDVPLAQRLDVGERVLWSAMPTGSSWSARRLATAAGSVVLFGASVQVLLHAVPPLRRVIGQHLLGLALSSMLVAGVAITTLLLVACAVGFAHWALLRPLRLTRETRYFITDRRVLIRRGSDELHLDRSRIAYVIEAPVGVRGGRANVFLVLDGPQALALAASGAFGERGESDTLVPVFAAIDDPQTVGEILRGPPSSTPLAA